MANLAARKIVLLGGSGMLGSTFVKHGVLGRVQQYGRETLDIRSPKAVVEAISSTSPDLIVNCVAETQVDQAEVDPAPSFAINALLPGLIGQAARSSNALVVHFSSTGCYGDNPAGKWLPHSDFDAPSPGTIHHKSKIAGELALRESGARALILRLGWLYGGSVAHRKNFVWARIREARAADYVWSDPYQSGSPTLVDDVVRQTVRLLESGIEGTYNCVAHGQASRYEYVEKIMEAAGLETQLRVKRFNRSAPVSENEAAMNTKLSLLGLDVMPDWDAALTGYVRTLLTEESALT